MYKQPKTKSFSAPPVPHYCHAQVGNLQQLNTLEVPNRLFFQLLVHFYLDLFSKYIPAILKGKMKIVDHQIWSFAEQRTYFDITHKLVNESLKSDHFGP